MPLSDDPVLLHRPIGFAVRINQAEELDVDAGRQRLPGLLKFARTFVAELLEDTERLPRLGAEADRARGEFAAASAKLRS